MDDRIGRLRAHQDAILAIIRGEEPMLTEPRLRDVAALARSRWALMRALTAYQLFKHGEIFDPAIGGTAPLGTQQAARMKRACLALGDEFRGYVSKWSGSDVDGQWATYQPAALAMIARLRDHLERERREVAALLDRAA